MAKSKTAAENVAIEETAVAEGTTAKTYTYKYTNKSKHYRFYSNFS